MSILSDTDLKQIVCFNENEFNEIHNILINNGSKDCFTPMGYDLRVGNYYKTLIGKPNLVYLKNEEKQKVIIKPGDVALIATLEQIKMPQNGKISGLILSKVSQVSKGISNVSTKVDPGWSEGELLIPIQNFSKDTIELDYEEKICTIIFITNQSGASDLYDYGLTREKFFKLMAQTKRDHEFSLQDKLIDFIGSILILSIFAVIGYLLFSNSTGVIALLTLGIALKTSLQDIVNQYLRAITDKYFK